MPRTRRELPRADKRDQILDAAEEAFANDGWDATTVASIAASVSVTATTIYWYFPTKDDLLAAIVERWAGVTIAELEALQGRLTPTQVARLVVIALEQLAQLLDALQERRRRSATVAAIHERVFERLISVLAGPAPTTERATAAEAFVLLTAAVVPHRRPGAEVLLEQALADARRHLDHEP